jgi:hypothetical protein
MSGFAANIVMSVRREAELHKPARSGFHNGTNANNLIVCKTGRFRPSAAIESAALSSQFPLVLKDSGRRRLSFLASANAARPLRILKVAPGAYSTPTARSTTVSR